jgi:uncharacterized membrane protein YfcA
MAPWAWIGYTIPGMFELAAAVLASFVAAIVNAIAGGGGLVSLPVMFAVFPTASPATLLGTSKAAMIWGTAWASFSYSRHVTLPWRTLVPAVICGLAGGAAGAWMLTLASPESIRRLLPFMLAAVLVYTLAHKELGSTHAPRHDPTREAFFASLISVAVGIYDGFFGPGTGSFFIFLFVRVLGFDFLHAVASAKVLNTATNLASVVYLAASGHVWWHMVVPMAVANVLGSMIGTRLALKHGSGLIRWIFLLVVAALILKSGYDSFGGMAAE